MIESNHVVLWNRCLDVIKDNVPETTSRFKKQIYFFLFFSC